MTKRDTFVLGSVLFIAVQILTYGCASQRTMGEEMVTESKAVGELGKQWSKGQELVSKGEGMIEEGEDNIAAGKAKIKKGERQIQRGKDMIEKGKRMIRESEDAYRLRRSQSG